MNFTDPSGRFLALVSVGASTILNTTLRGLTAGAIVGAFSGGGIAFVSGGNIYTGAVKGAIYGGLFGAAIGFAYSTGRIIDVICDGIIAGGSNVFGALLSSWTRHQSITGAEIGMAFLDALVWGTVESSFAGYIAKEMEKSGPLVHASIAFSSSMIQDFGTYCSDLGFRKPGTPKFGPFVVTALLRGIKAGLYACVAETADTSYKLSEADFETLMNLIYGPIINIGATPYMDMLNDFILEWFDKH